MGRPYAKYLKFVPILIIAFILFRIVNHTEILLNAYNFLATLLAPIIWACLIAYLLNPLLNLIEKHVKIKRFFSIFLVYTFVLLILASLLTVIIPIMFNSIADILRELPSYAVQANKWYEERLRDIETLERFVNTYNFSLESLVPVDLELQLTKFSQNAQNFAMSLGRALFDFTSGIFKFIMGLIISIYLLSEKEALVKQTKRVVRAFLGEKKGHMLINLITEIDEVFGRYLIGKTIDSLIIGILCYIGLLTLQVKYALLLAFIVGVTNMIPYFGPIIGAVPAVVITLFYSPITALWVAIFILILQQLDGNIIGPKILGDSVGMSPLWIIVAIIIGGGLFGVMGMLLGVPVMAVIRNFVNRHVDKVLTPENKT